jgi:PAS domain S-box-containing protein
LGQQENWAAFQAYNDLPATQRGAALPGLGVLVDDEDVQRLLTKSHFVIPGHSRFECQRCGECCRYARKVAQLTYESCPFLTEDNSCRKHDSRYLVCKWFPFWVLERPGKSPLLTIKPYCSGYSHGPLIDYNAVVARIRQVARMELEKPDGATVIHEVLMIPGRSDWVFPSKANVDELLQQVRQQMASNMAPSTKSPERNDGVSYAQQYTSGLLGGIGEPLLTVGEDGFIKDANEQACALLGQDRSMLVGQVLADHFVNPERVASRLAACFSRGRELASPQRLCRPGKETVPVLLNAMTYRAREDGLVHAALVCLNKVSPVIFSEMNQSREYARGLLEASLDALMVIDKDGAITDVNEAVVLATGRSRESLVGASFADLFLCQEKARQGVALTFTQGKVQNFELTMICSGQAPIPVSFNATVYRDADGVVQGIFAAARDIRERLRLIRELEEAKHYARGLIECCIDLMVTINHDGVITDANHAATWMTERPLSQLVGKPFRNFFDDSTKAQAGVTLAFERGEVRNYEINLVTASGRRVPTVFNATPFCDPQGNVQGIFAIARAKTNSDGGL